MITDKYTIRQQNETKILKAIIDEKQVSRAQLSSLTGLNKASVSDITKSLLENQLVIETGIGEVGATGGRKPIWLQFNNKAAYILSIDVGPDYLEGILTFADGKIANEISYSQIKVSSKTILQKIETMKIDLLKSIDEDQITIGGMVIAIHGLVFQNEILFTPHYDLDTFPLYEKLVHRYPFPIYLENEANLAALGEYTFASLSENLISVSIHTGIGAGIVEKGNLRLGYHGKAGEIGHTVLFPNGKSCPCGNKGCLEQYASNSVLYKRFSKNYQINKVNSDLIAQYYRNNDEYTMNLVNEIIYYLSVGINSLCASYDPEIIVINSSLFRKIPNLIAILRLHLNTHYSKNILVRNTHLKNKATLFGGVSLAVQKFLNIQNLRFPQ